MLPNEIRESEGMETVVELSDLFSVVQEMGRRLASETHGDLYDQVQALNIALHRARMQLNEIRDQMKS